MLSRTYFVSAVRCNDAFGTCFRSNYVGEFDWPYAVVVLKRASCSDERDVADELFRAVTVAQYVCNAGDLTTALRVVAARSDRDVAF